MDDSTERPPRADSPITQIHVSEQPHAADTNSPQANEAHNDASFAHIGAWTQVQSAAVAVDSPGNNDTTLETSITSYSAHAADIPDYFSSTPIADIRYKRAVQRRCIRRWIERTRQRRTQRAHNDSDSHKEATKQA